MKILTICPTNKIELIKKMITSFNDTKSFSHLILGVNINDKNLNQYKNLNTDVCICEADATVTQIINSIYSQYPDYDYYHLTNDDVIYHTKGWDKNMANILEEYGPGIIYGDDLFQKENLPTFPFISQEIVKSIGWLQMPLLNRYYGDMVWKYIGQNIGCIYYCHYVIIEHMHYLAGKGEYPVDMDIYEKDGQSFGQWMATKSIGDINKIRLRIFNQDIKKVRAVCQD